MSPVESLQKLENLYDQRTGQLGAGRKITASVKGLPDKFGKITDALRLTGMCGSVGARVRTLPGASLRRNRQL